MLEITNEMLSKRNEFMVLVSNLTGVPVDDMAGRRRCGDISTARQLVMWALVVLCGYTHTEVGRLMRRNHATVTYAVSFVERGYKANKLQPIKQKLKTHYNERNGH